MEELNTNPKPEFAPSDITFVMGVNTELLEASVHAAAQDRSLVLSSIIEANVGYPLSLEPGARKDSLTAVFFAQAAGALGHPDAAASAFQQLADNALVSSQAVATIHSMAGSAWNMRAAGVPEPEIAGYVYQMVSGEYGRIAGEEGQDAYQLALLGLVAAATLAEPAQHLALVSQLGGEIQRMSTGV